MESATAWFIIVGLLRVDPLHDAALFLVLRQVAASIVVHGVSATPLMERYRRRA